MRFSKKNYIHNIKGVVKRVTGWEIAHLPISIPNKYTNVEHNFKLGQKFKCTLGWPPSPDEISSYTIAYYIFVYLIEIRLILNLPIFLVNIYTDIKFVFQLMIV